MRLKISCSHRESGTALVEFVIVCVVLIPIMFGIPMIGKMIDLKQSTAQASRYSAWETTVHRSETLPQAIDQRFFSDASAPIGSTEIGPNSLWGPEAATAQNGTATESLSGYHADTAVVVSPGATSPIHSAYDAGVSNGNQYAPGARHSVAYRVGQAVDALGVLAHKTDGVWTGEHDDEMNANGFIRGEASVQMQANGWLGPQTITQGTVIMNDQWSAAGALEARNRVRPLVPANALEPVGRFLGNIGKVPGLRELKYFGHDGGHGVFGHIDMEPLPPSEDGLRPLKDYVER